MGGVKESISFTLRGIGYTLNRENVISTMKGLKPDWIKKYYMEIGGEHYPPKQVLSQARARAVTSPPFSRILA